MIDISRFLLQPRKHYVGARLQQGRVLLDSDFNEEAQLDDEEQRRVLQDVIGPTGSPDDGFTADLSIGSEVTLQAVSFNGAAPIDVLNFRLRPGSMYVGGLRFEHEPVGLEQPLRGDPIVFQRDFLQMPADATPQPQPGNQTQLTFVHAWEQHISVVEDEEIRERALGGVDTSARVRRMARVEVRDVDNSDDCTSGWTAVRQQVEAASGGAFDAAGTELRSSARLRMAFEPGVAEDPCAPCAPDDVGRYLGADNQAIRIMLAEGGRYVWAFDNASPLYRVRVGETVDATTRIEMLTPPHDEAKWPLANTVVEFLPWSAVLDNGQKIAGEVGVFLRVDRGYDPDDGSFGVAAADLPQLDALFQQWDAAHPNIGQLPNEADPDGRFLFLRVWHRLDSAADDVLLDTGPNPANHALLVRHGLRPEFSGGGRPGDYWVVTVRPNTPQQIVPWNLTQSNGVPPHGPRHFYAPLNLISFREPQPGEHENTKVVASIQDCRRRFRPLIDTAGCCTHTVGDGVVSRGDFLSVQAAVNALPERGGKVCILPGTFAEEVSVTRDDVTLEGCGPLTRLETPAGAQPTAALIHVVAQRVRVREITLATRGQIGVLVGDEDLDAPLAANDITIEQVEVRADERDEVGGQTRSTVDIRRGRNVTIENCELFMDGSVTDEACVFVRGEDITVKGNRIETFPTGAEFGAWGGIQLGGNSLRITVTNNTISGGLGHGITIGSIRWVAETVRTRLNFGAGAGLQNTFDPCAPKQIATKPIEVENLRFDPETAGDLEDIVISGNRIEMMQGNGISVLTTFPLADDGGQDMITVNRITIQRNRIVNNVVQSSSLASASPVAKTAKLAPGEEEVFGQFLVSHVPPGGIVLLDGEHIVIRDNDIIDNGTSDVEAICGVCVVFGNGILIEGNRIQNNGLREPGSIPSIDSMRSGIAVSLAGVASNTDEQNTSDTLGSSLRILGNVVEHPNGTALTARATGPVLVEGNYLLSEGNNATAQRASTAHALALVNVGLPWEAVDLPANEPSPDRWVFPNRTPEYLRGEGDDSVGGGVGGPNDGARIGFGGRIVFNNNHVVLRWIEANNAAGGLASGFGVGICTLDDITMNGNQFALNVEDPGIKKTPTGVFNRQPRITSHVVVVGATANVGNNRVSEGVNDALISLLVLGGLMVSSSYKRDNAYEFRRNLQLATAVGTEFTCGAVPS